MNGLFGSLVINIHRIKNTLNYCFNVIFFFIPLIIIGFVCKFKSEQSIITF